MEHGTRSCYTQRKCRCEPCKKANRDYAKFRNDRLKALAQSLDVKVEIRTAEKQLFGEGTTQVKRRYCLGVEGKGCPKNVFLKANSAGNLCSYCRESLIERVCFVPTDRAREHLKMLRRRGIGRRTVEDLTGIAHTSLYRIVSKKAEIILPKTEEAILAVSPDFLRDNTLWPASPTKRLLREMRKMGYTTRELAILVGQPRSNAPQFKGRKVYAGTAMRVLRAYLEALEGKELSEAALTTCDDCGLSHAQEARLVRLARMLPCTTTDIYDAYPCVYDRKKYSKDVGESRMLFRDLHALGSEHFQGIWTSPGTAARPEIGGMW